jgi:hypothetical protein
VSGEIQIQSFEHLNALFKEKLSDSSLYCGTRYSYLKIFQHALTYEQAGADYRILKNYLHWPLLAQRALLQYKAIRRSPGTRLTLREIVFIDPARIARDNSEQWHSIYMERAVNLFDTSKISVLSRKKEPRLRCDASLDAIPRNFAAPDHTEIALLKEVIEVAQRTLRSDAWSEKQKAHILSALHVFFDDFRFYYALFQKQPVKSVVFISHYHNEGLIAALNILGIRCVEFQHGLISGNDLYYQYPAVFKEGIKNAFFPDNICVYGNYWKELLLKGVEFNDSSITVGGDYLWQPEAQPQATAPNQQVLICAQKNMHAEYVAYAKQLKPCMDKHPEWKWVIKMHPLEKNKELYRALESDGFVIIDSEQSLSLLLRESRIQISIYSTTFFDALGFEISNYALQEYSIYKDYAAQMIAEGVAQALYIDEDPIEKYLQSNGTSSLRPRKEVYGPFDAKAILGAIAGR